MQVLPAIFAQGAAGASLATGLQTAASVAGVVSSVAASSYQASLAANQAAVLEEEATNARIAGQINQQERDLAAQEIIEQDIATQAGSGLELGSTSQRRRHRRLKILARRDALRLRHDAERQALSLENQAQAKKAEGKAAKSSMLFNAVGGALNIGSSLLDGQTFTNQLTAQNLQLQAGAV